MVLLGKRPSQWVDIIAIRDVWKIWVIPRSSRLHLESMHCAHSCLCRCCLWITCRAQVLSFSKKLSVWCGVRLVASKVNQSDINSGCVLDRGFPGGSDGKESACNAGDLGSSPGSGKSPGEGNGYPLQYVCLGNPMDRGTWWATVYGAAKSWIQLSDYHYRFLSCISHQFSSVQSLSHVWLFATLWTAAAIALNKLFSADVLWFPIQNTGVVTVLVLHSCGWFISVRELIEHYSWLAVPSTTTPSSITYSLVCDNCPLTFIIILLSPSVISPEHTWEPRGRQIIAPLAPWR